jgi:TrmH family RNA methyltransferase
MKNKIQEILKHYLLLKKDKVFCTEKQSLLIESSKLINELKDLGIIKGVMTVDEKLVPAGIPEEQIFLVPPKMIERVSSLKKSEGIIAEVSMPRYTSLKDKKKLIAFDNIQDPGNLGTLIRSALAFGFDGAIFLNNTCDPFNDKALRAARGSTFKIALQKDSLDDLKDFPLLIADIKGKNPEDVKSLDKFILLMGNEAHGPSKAYKGTKISLPMKEGVESLNVAIAGSILMYLLAKERP